MRVREPEEYPLKPLGGYVWWLTGWGAWCVIIIASDVTALAGGGIRLWTIGTLALNALLLAFYWRAVRREIRLRIRTPQQVRADRTLALAAYVRRQMIRAHRIAARQHRLEGEH